MPVGAMPRCAMICWSRCSKRALVIRKRAQIALVCCTAAPTASSKHQDAYGNGEEQLPRNRTDRGMHARNNALPRNELPEKIDELRRGAIARRLLCRAAEPEGVVSAFPNCYMLSPEAPV